MMKLRLLTLFSAAALFQGSALACDMHGGGFGFSPMAHAIYAQGRMAPVSPLTLTHSSIVFIETQNPSTVKLRFSAPPGVEDMQLSLGASPSLSLDNEDTVALIGNTGFYTLEFFTDAPGEHKIELQLNAKIDGKQRQVKRQIRVIAEAPVKSEVVE